jgi:hypothetical protein
MEGKRLLRSIQLRNILSYGPESESVELEPLNILIGGFDPARFAGKRRRASDCLRL